MTANKKPSGSDFEKVDAHTITPEEYVEIPELTQADLARGTRMQNGKPAPRGRPRVEAPKRTVTLRLDAEVMDRLRATGAGWQGRANAMLRKSLGLEGSDAPK